MGMRVDYARVSTVGQKLDVQLDRLSDCDRIFKEKASAGTTEKRHELSKRDICEIFGISRSSVYRLYGEYKQGQTGVCQ